MWSLPSFAAILGDSFRSLRSSSYSEETVTADETTCSQLSEWILTRAPADMTISGSRCVFHVAVPAYRVDRSNDLAESRAE